MYLMAKGEFAEFMEKEYIKFMAREGGRRTIDQFAKTAGPGLLQEMTRLFYHKIVVSGGLVVGYEAQSWCREWAI